MSFLTEMFNGQAKKLKAYEPIVARANELEPAISALTDIQLKAKTIHFKERIAAATSGKTGEEYEKAEKAVLDEIMPEAFAVVREASKRTLGQRHFDVQLMGGAILHNGNIAEMRTGEGKTLVATLPAYLNALDGQRRACRHGQRLPLPPRRRLDGADLQCARPLRRRHQSRIFLYL